MSWIILLFVIYCVLTIHELGHFIACRLFKVTVSEVAMGIGPVLYKRSVGRTNYSLRLFPIGAFIRPLGINVYEKVSTEEINQSFSSLPTAKKVVVSAAGLLTSLFVGFVLLFLIAYRGSPVESRTIGGVLPGGPAAIAGLVPGDVIVKVGGEDMSSWKSLDSLAAGDATISISFERDRRTMTALMTPDNRKYLIGWGMSPMISYSPASFGSAFESGITYLVKFLLIEYKSMKLFLTGNIPIKELSTAIDFTTYAAVSVSDMIYKLIFLAAIFSVFLFILNFIPLSVLDGGMILLFLYEGIAGKPAPFKARQFFDSVSVGTIGFLLIYGVIV